MTQPRQPDQFAIVPIYSDSAGRNAAPQDAICVGSYAAVMARIRDSRQQREALQIINDAAHAKGTLKSIREREEAVSEREQAVAEREEAVARTMLEHAMQKLDQVALRLDAAEHERARDPDDDELPTPPGIASGIASDEVGGNNTATGDDGHLQSPLVAPLGPEPDLAKGDQSRATVTPQDQKP